MTPTAAKALGDPTVAIVPIRRLVQRRGHGGPRARRAARVAKLTIGLAVAHSILVATYHILERKVPYEDQPDGAGRSWPSCPRSGRACPGAR
jgi:hypothetical protein